MDVIGFPSIHGLRTISEVRPRILSVVELFFLIFHIFRGMISVREPDIPLSYSVVI